MYLTSEQIAQEALSGGELDEFLQGNQRVITASVNKFYVVWEKHPSGAKVLAHYKVTDIELDPRHGLQVTLVGDTGTVVWVDTNPQKLPNSDIFVHVPADARVQMHHSETKCVRWCSVPVVFNNKSQYGKDKGPFVSDLGWFRANLPNQKNLHLD